MKTIKTEVKSKVYEMSIIGLMAAIMCIFGPLSIPIGLVPISLTNLIIFVSLYVLGMKKGTTALVIYLLVGLAGLPVFSDFSGGPSKLLGPTGGYLIGFIFMALIAGYFIDRYSSYRMTILGMVLATGILYIFGSLWLAYQTNMAFTSALAVGVIPFIAGDFLKIIISVYLGSRIRDQLIRAKLI